MTISLGDDSKKIKDSFEKVLLIKLKRKLPKEIKSKLKRLGAIWYEPFEAYVSLLEKRKEVEELLAPWKEKVAFSGGYVDPHLFSAEGKVRNNQDVRSSILREQAYDESIQLMADIHSYNSALMECDFDEKPESNGKTAFQFQKEMEFYERKQSILEKKKELETIESNLTKVRQGPNPYCLDEEGLWCIPDEGERIWIASPFRITARTRDQDGLNHGKIIEFDDSDGIHHRWAMPMEMLAGDSSELRKILLNTGLDISTFFRARQYFADYVQRSAPSFTERCISHTGWYKEGFVLPDGTIGNIGLEKVIVQGKNASVLSYAQSGTLYDWQKHIADLCVGNSRLIFAVSAGFAAPLLSLLDIEGGGFHFRSTSSSGKTTALCVASSLYGDRTFMRKWKATINALELTAFQHNDVLLCLDEIGEMNPHDVGDTAYMLANGGGKGRSRSDITLREPFRWKLLFLSSGEESLVSLMEQVGKKTKAGQEVRLADIPADTGCFGVFEELHGFSDGAVFADSLVKAAHTYYGSAIREFLKKLTQDIESAKNFMKEQIASFLSEVVVEGTVGQIYRVASRFALVAAAGELSIHYNITRVMGADAMASIGWDGGMARCAAKKCFEDWLEAYGGATSREETQLVADLRYFIEQNGESRFTDWNTQEAEPAENKYRTYNRAGFRKKTFDGYEFYFYPETFRREICKGRDEKFVKETLFKRGLLKKDSQDRYSLSAKPASEANSQRFVVIIWEKEELS